MTDHISCGNTGGEEDYGIDMEKEDYDPHDNDDGEEVETSESCQTLHELMKSKIYEIIEGISNDVDIKLHCQRNDSLKPQQTFKRKERDIKHGV